MKGEENETRQTGGAKTKGKSRLVRWCKEKKNEKYRVESLLEKNFREDGKEQ